MPADVSQLLALADDFDRAGAKVARKTVEAVTEAAEAGAEVAKVAAPFRTGTLRDSIGITASGSGGAAGARATIRATASYSWYVYAGTARQAPQPEFMDQARETAEQTLVTALERAADEVLG